MRKSEVKQIIKLQLIIILYTVSGIMAKIASMRDHLIWIGAFFALDLLFLGIYAIFWQQLIKFFSLSVAYANRAMALLWSALWAKILFGETISKKQIIAIVLVIIGTIFVNMEERKNEE